MSGPRLGSLCSGYGGLEMAVQAVLGGETAWVSDIDKGACKILAHRFPGVPNIGDMTAVDWTQVEPVDVLTGGTPCPDLSHAGKRGGMREGMRSNLWVAMREAIAALRPSLVVWENVSGAYSAEADSELESDPRLLAGTRRRGGEPVLRALGRVLGDLATLGYVGGWHGLRAADVGAPHGRLRVFVVATDAKRGRRDRWAPLPRGGEGERVAPQGAGEGALLPTPAVYDGDRGGPQHPDKRLAGGHSVTLQDAVHGLLPTPTARDWKNVGDPDKTADRMADRGQPLGEVVVNALLPTPACNDMGEGKTPDEWDAWTARMKAAHGNGNGHGASLSIEVARLTKESNDADPTEEGPGEDLRDVRRAADSQEVRERQARGSDGVPQEEALLAEVREQPQGDPARQSPLAGAAGRGEGDLPGLRDDRAPARTSPRPEPGEQRAREPVGAVCLMPPETALAGGLRGPCGCDTSWGQYEAAVRRWMRVLGRCAPPPTQLSPQGRPRLDARFSEFMMGLPAGWVTDVPGITRNEAMRALGNGVVVQQAEAAIRFLLNLARAAA